MQNRPAFQLKNILIVYNTFQIVANLLVWIFVSVFIVVVAAVVGRCRPVKCCSYLHRLWRTRTFFFHSLSLSRSDCAVDVFFWNIRFSMQRSQLSWRWRWNWSKSSFRHVPLFPIESARSVRYGELRWNLSMNWSHFPTYYTKWGISSILSFLIYLCSIFQENFHKKKKIISISFSRRRFSSCWRKNSLTSHFCMSIITLAW